MQSPSIIIGEERRAAIPYVVEWPGLTREHISDAKFEEKLCAPRNWCKERCPDRHKIEPSGNGAGL
jgi:hypothetical protein